jgi:hypothetical protein
VLFFGLILEYERRGRAKSGSEVLPVAMHTSAIFSTECGRIRVTARETTPCSTIGCAWHACCSAACPTDCSQPTSSVLTMSTGGNADASLRADVQIPLLDPMALVLAMAYATTHLGFGAGCLQAAGSRST